MNPNLTMSERTFIANLRTIRVANALTQEEMSTLIGIPRSRYGSYEEGRACPPVDLMLTISTKFGIELSFLLTQYLPRVELKSTGQKKRQGRPLSNFSIY